MTSEAKPEDIVGAALEAFVAHLRARDLEGTLRLFAPGAALYGSEADEIARGAPGCGRFWVLPAECG